MANGPGKWSGHGIDTFAELDNPLWDFDLNLVFQAKGKKIQGKGEISWEVETQGATLAPASTPRRSGVAMDFEGGFLTEDYMQLIYRSHDQSRKQMGVIVFRLNLEGDTLTGHYAGLSPTRGVFVSGNVTLEKKAFQDGRPYLREGV